MDLSGIPLSHHGGIDVSCETISRIRHCHTANLQDGFGVCVRGQGVCGLQRDVANDSVSLKRYFFVRFRSCQYGYRCCCADNSQMFGRSQMRMYQWCAGMQDQISCVRKYHADGSHLSSGRSGTVGPTTCVVEALPLRVILQLLLSQQSEGGADFSGRCCSSDLQCACNEGVFSCDVAACPECPVDAEDVTCPAQKPQHLSECCVVLHVPRQMDFGIALMPNTYVRWKFAKRRLRSEDTYRLDVIEGLAWLGGPKQHHSTH